MTRQQVKSTGLTHIRLRVSDLNMMKSFLEDFGLMTALQTEGVIYSRGSDDRTYAHIAEHGNPGIIGFGLCVSTFEDPEILSKAKDASDIEEATDAGI